MGREWAFVALTNTDVGLKVRMYTGTYFQGYDKTELVESVDIQQGTCYLRVHVDDRASCAFSYSLTGTDYKPIGKEFAAKPGTWIGAKVGLFNINPNITESKGYADFDWFRYEYKLPTTYSFTNP